MWPIINTYRELRHNGRTRHQAVRELWRALDDLLTLLVAIKINEKNLQHPRQRCQLLGARHVDSKNDV